MRRGKQIAAEQFCFADNIRSGERESKGGKGTVDLIG